jgi:hypothetical protein
MDFASRRRSSPEPDEPADTNAACERSDEATQAGSDEWHPPRREVSAPAAADYESSSLLSVASTDACSAWDDDDGALDPVLRRRFERSLGEDFHDVTVAAALPADDVAQGVQAVASPERITVAPELLTGQHSPETTATLGEEFAHIAQKRRGSLASDGVDRDGPARGWASPHRDALEDEAKAAGARAAVGAPAFVASGAAVPARQFSHGNQNAHTGHTQSTLTSAQNATTQEQPTAQNPTPAHDPLATMRPHGDAAGIEQFLAQHGVTRDDIGEIRCDGQIISRAQLEQRLQAAVPGATGQAGTAMLDEYLAQHHPQPSLASLPPDLLPLLNQAINIEVTARPASEDSQSIASDASAAPSSSSPAPSSSSPAPSSSSPAPSSSSPAPSSSSPAPSSSSPAPSSSSPAPSSSSPPPSSGSPAPPSNAQHSRTRREVHFLVNVAHATTGHVTLRNHPSASIDPSAINVAIPVNFIFHDQTENGPEVQVAGFFQYNPVTGQASGGGQLQASWVWPYVVNICHHQVLVQHSIFVQGQAGGQGPGAGSSAGAVGQVSTGYQVAFQPPPPLDWASIGVVAGPSLTFGPDGGTADFAVQVFVQAQLPDMIRHRH